MALSATAASAGPATHFLVSAPSSATAGTAFNFTVTALDSGNSVDTTYSGPVHFTSTDGAATLPADSTLTNGVGTFSATLKTAGSQTITATDTVTSSITGTSSTIAVSAAAATHYTVSAPASANGNVAFSFTVTAQDQFNNTATGYAGTVHFTSTDAQAVLPANSTLTNGTGTFSATLKTAGSQTITTTDAVTSSITGTSGAINVSSTGVTHFTVSAPASATAGTAFNFTVTALDSSNAVVTSYSGTVHFTSSDAAATLPANATLTNGTGTFSATLNTAGNQTITATDTANAAITGTSSAIAVSAPKPTTTTLGSSPNPSAARQTVTFTATITSSGGTPTGTVTFSDGGVAIGLASLSGGIAVFATTQLSTGNHTITATYAGAAGFAASASAALLQVVNAPLDSLKLRAMQVMTTPVVAQVSGQAISGAVDSAIGEAFSPGGALITPSASGIRVNFAASTDGQAAASASQAIDRSAPLNPAERDGASSRVQDAFSALAYAGPTKAPPMRATEPRDWLAWAEVRGAVLDHLYSPTLGAAALYGDQVNLLAGVSRKILPNFVIGVLGGWETFDYRSDGLSGHLKGDGWTAGAYLGWKLTDSIRYDLGASYSGIGYDGTAGTAAGSFTGRRVLAVTGFTGTYGLWGAVLEPSARVYALWEHENAYTDTLGTLQAARNFSTGRASGGLKLIFPFQWTASVGLTPYIGAYGDYYFNTDDGRAAISSLVPAALVQDGWSARAVGGISARFVGGAQVAIGTERAGIGSNFALWTYRARASIPFSAQ
ncbi:Ig-like domain repeat protein [Bradyrhizobium genosp. A]|uniref:Ig-like domain repeat protein n=1 Tax=Bradyrhizobium genosp. A TaxID=83626 RepID=UPI003CF4CE5A